MTAPPGWLQVGLDAAMAADTGAAPRPAATAQAAREERRAREAPA